MMAHRLLSHVAPACFALYLTSNLLVRSFSDIWLFVGFLAFCCGMAAAALSKTITKGPRWIWIGLLGLLALHALAIPGSLLWGADNWELTAGVLLWMIPAACLYLLQGPLKVLLWLTPAWLIHGGLTLFQGFTNWYNEDGHLIWQGSPTGLANNANLAAGFAALGVVYFLTRQGPTRWLALPLLVSVFFTGSRWGVAVILVILIMMAVTRAIPWSVLCGSILAIIGAVLILAALGNSPYAIAGMNSLAGIAATITVDVGERLAIPHIPSFLPSGVAEHPGLHNVPLRVAVESGMLAALLWIGITLWALARYKDGAIWWLLLTLVLLSMLDYYTWMGHLGGFWWLLIGALTKTPSGDSGWLSAKRHSSTSSVSGTPPDWPGRCRCPGT